MYLFDMKNGRKKLAYGVSPEDALQTLRLRLTDEEMSQLVVDKYIKVSQRKLQEFVQLLG